MRGPYRKDAWEAPNPCRLQLSPSAYLDETASLVLDMLSAEEKEEWHRCLQASITGVASMAADLARIEKGQEFLAPLLLTARLPRGNC